MLFAQLYMRYIYFAQFDHHVANSEYTAAELIPASRGHTTRRGIWVCPMGVDTQMFTPRPARAHAGRRLLYAGRVAREKNVQLLIQALERLDPEYKPDVIGDGPMRDWFLENPNAGPQGGSNSTATSRTRRIGCPAAAGGCLRASRGNHARVTSTLVPRIYCNMKSGLSQFWSNPAAPAF